MRCEAWWFWLLLVGSALAAPHCLAGEDDENRILPLQEILLTAQFNHAAVDEQYIGKELQVQGRAVRVVRHRPDKDAPVQYIVTLATATPPMPMPVPMPAAAPEMNFVFAAKERPGLADIRRGSQVVIQGTCRELVEAGNGLPLRFEDCRLMRIIHEAPPTVTVDGAAEWSPAAPTVPRGAPPGGFPMVPPRALPLPMR